MPKRIKDPAVARAVDGANEEWNEWTEAQRYTSIDTITDDIHADIRELLED